MGLNSLFRVIVLAVFIASIAHETTSDVVHRKQNLRQYHMTRDAEFDHNYINGKLKYIAIPHYSDCRSYYVVNHRGNFIRLECREGKLFDNESLQCKRREEAKCWRKHRQDDGEISSDWHGSKAAKKKFECPSDFGSFPDPEDCSRWYLCLFSRPQNRKCRKGELYDKIKKECAEKSTVDCNADPEKDEEKFKCPHTYGEYPYPEDCSKYFLCKQKKSSVAECKEGKLFDTKKKECREESKVDCGSRFNPNANLFTSRATTTQITDEHVHTYPHGMTTPKTTKGSNKIMTPSINRSTKDYNTNPSLDVSTDGDSTGDPTTETASTDKDSSGTKVPYSEMTTSDNDGHTTEPHTETASTDKDSSGTEVSYSEITTSDNDGYSTETFVNLSSSDYATGKSSVEMKTHDYITNQPSVAISRTDDTLIAESPTVTKEPEIISSPRPTIVLSPKEIDWKSTSVDPSNICSPQDGTCVTDSAGGVIRCPDKSGYFPHPTDPKSFLHCHNFKIYLKTCPANLVFNPINKVCTWP